MIGHGFGVSRQKIFTGSDGIYDYYESVYWVQKRITFLGIPIFVENVKAFESSSAAIRYIDTLDSKNE